jgi:anti-anti-sigma regulatory factor
LGKERGAHLLTAKTEYKGKLYIVRLEGKVDDEADFDAAIGALPAKADVAVVCSNITRINSVGVKSWIRFFSKAKENGVHLKYVDCSPPIVQQINMVFNFLCGGEVISIQASFACAKCGTNFLKSLETLQIRKANFKIPNQKCPKCEAEAEFDDIPAMYFKFMTAARR